MMFTCGTPACTDPRHGHRPVLALRQGAAKTAGAPRAVASASPKVVRNSKGRSLRIDIHCHYLNPEVQAKLMPLDPGQYDPARVYANALSREVNVKQMKDRAPKLSTIEVRLKDMDRMGIDIQAVSPAPNQCSYWAEPGLGLEISRMPRRGQRRPARRRFSPHPRAAPGWCGDRAGGRRKLVCRR